MLDYSKLYLLENTLAHNPQLVHSGQLRKGVTRIWKGGTLGNRVIPDKEIPAKWSFFDTEILDAKIVPDEPLKFIYKRQAKLNLYTKCEVCFHFFHESVVELMNKIGATGISYYPTIIEHKREKRIITEYWGLQISGRYGKIDKSRGIIVPHFLPNGYEDKRIKGMYFTDDFWDGKDFAVSEYHSFIVISERIKEVLTKHKVTGVNLIPLPDYLLLTN